MNTIVFNKKLFCVYEDPIFRIANYIHENRDVSMAVKEFLFFSRGDALLKDGTNLLATVEMYSELYSYIEKWFLDMDILQSNDDWKYHKSKLHTRLKLIKSVDFDLVDQYKEQQGSKYLNETREIRNALVRLANASYYNSKHKIDDKYRCSDNRWLMWRELVLYRNGEIDKMTGMVDFAKEFDKLIKFKEKSEVFDITLTEFKVHHDAVEKIKKDFESIYLKNNLEKNLPIMQKVKNVFKI